MNASYIHIYPKLLGKGAFGEVSLGLDQRNGRLLAVKKESKKSDKENGRVLKHENSILKFIGSPAVLFWEDQSACYMAIPLLGPSLDRLHQRCNNKFSLQICATLGIQMIEQIEFCHNKGVLHRDIKPANFLVNYSLPHKSIKLVDFGLAKKYVNVPYRSGVARVGNLRYMSKYIHNGIESSRRDDIYSIGYVIIYMFVGHLPWKGVIQNLTLDEKHKAVLAVKEKFTNRRLANKNTCAECAERSLPCSFVNTMIKFMDHADSLAFEDKPDYNRLKSYLQETLISHGFVEDLRFKI